MSELKETVDIRRGWTSASNAEADSLCAARHLRQKGLPDLSSKQNDSDRDTGSRIHKALATRNPEGLVLDERDTYDACCAIEDKLVEEFFGPDANTARGKVWREQRYWVKIRNAQNGQVYEHSGQPDVVYFANQRGLIIEYKALRGDVAVASSNLQLRDQAVLVKGHFVLVRQLGTVVIQPMVTHSPEICGYSPEQIAQAEVEMFNRVRASNTPGQIATAGEKQCEHCRAKNDCPEYNRFAGSMVPGMLSILDVSVGDWTPQQRAIFCSNKAVAQKWLDNCEAAIKLILQKDPDGVPGWGLAPGRKLERITNPQGVFERFSKLGGKLEDFMSCITVGKEKLKTALSTVTGARGKALDGAMGTVLDGFTESTTSAPSLRKLEK